MNETAIRHALSLANTAYVTDATKIAPHILERIVDGAVPTPEQIDLLYGYFKGEFFLSGTDFNWKRNAPLARDPLPLPQAGPAVPGGKRYDPFAPPPSLNAGPEPTGTGAVGDGVTGTGLRVK